MLDGRPVTNRQNAAVRKPWDDLTAEQQLRLREEYGNPEVAITENGYPTIEEPGREVLEDPDRIAYLGAHVEAVGRAIRAGSRCTGFFCWTLMDNFEWSNGLRTRFGLVRVDFATQERRWRSSARWYRDLIAANAIEASGGDAP